jgi:hypothetical protein
MTKQDSGTNWLIGLASGVGAVASYLLVMRPWMLSWGATKEEQNRLLPGDELLPEPKIYATHAITIQAPPSVVWPWLAQLGQGRGGFYSYDWIENMMGLDIHNANQILPQYQDIKVGDAIPLAPNAFSVPVAIVDKERCLVLHGDTRLAQPGETPPMKPGEFLSVSWGFYLFPSSDGSTRLIERWKTDWSPSLQNNVFYRMFMEPGAFLMERKMLLGIKQRAEALVG